MIRQYETFIVFLNLFHLPSTVSIIVSYLTLILDLYHFHDLLRALLLVQVTVILTYSIEGERCPGPGRFFFAA